MRSEIFWSGKTGANGLLRMFGDMVSDEGQRYTRAQALFRERGLDALGVDVTRHSLGTYEIDSGKSEGDPEVRRIAEGVQRTIPLNDFGLEPVFFQEGPSELDVGFHHTTDDRATSFYTSTTSDDKTVRTVTLFEPRALANNPFGHVMIEQMQVSSNQRITEGDPPLQFADVVKTIMGRT